ncbi:MAG: hypothetical protein EBZ69_00850 [Alphaproteobacteria bacterium]|nr:hypothetical protein [Alphaproteobacteria bacterium]NDG04328.1 hypothetical protein [Alphaproteobacteria bacterium]
MSKNTEETRVDLNVVKDLIAIREKIRNIQQELKVIYSYIDQTADDFMESLIARGNVESHDYLGDKNEDLAG